MNNDSDEPLVAQTCDGEDWVDRYGDALFRFAMSRTGNASTAEDLVQDTFVAAVTARNQFRNESSVWTWLFAILKRRIADHYRRQGRRPIESQVIDGKPEHVSERSLPRGNRTWSDDPAKICEDREFWIAFDACVDKMPDRLAEVFILREINGQSTKEIRELLGISATNLSMRLHRGRLAVRDCLNKHWFQDDR